MVGELNDIRARLEAALAPLAGEPSELDGGITNRNFRVRLGAEEYVVRRPGKDTQLLGIDRGSEQAANEAAAALGIAPPVATVVGGCLVTAYVACEPLSRGELASRVEEVAHALRAFHDSGARLAARFAVPELLDGYARIVRERGGEPPADYERARTAAAQVLAALPRHAPQPCHNDLLPGNLIRARADGRIMLVDWEYAGVGDARFDLGNLSINNDFDERANDRLLAAYDGAPPSDARRAQLKLARVLSDAREAAWGVVQGAISELDFDFAGYAREHFERLRAVAERPEFDEWLASAASDEGSTDGQAA